MAFLNNFYYLVTALPDLRIGEVPDITFRELDQLLRNNLTESNYSQIRLYKSYFDVLNIRAYVDGDELDPRGNLDVKRLEEAIIGGAGLQKWTRSYYDKYKTKQERTDHFPELLALYFREADKEARGVLKRYLKFERDLRLVLLGFRAKKLRRDLLKELQFEDPDEQIIAELLAQKDSKTYEPPEGFEPFRAIFEEYQGDPRKFHQALEEYRFEQVRQMVGLNVFNMDYVMGYTIQLVMVEKWLELDKKKGLEIVERIVKGEK